MSKCNDIKQHEDTEHNMGDVQNNEKSFLSCYTFSINYLTTHRDGVCENMSFLEKKNIVQVCFDACCYKIYKKNVDVSVKNRTR